MRAGIENWVTKQGEALLQLGAYAALNSPEQVMAGAVDPAVESARLQTLAAVPSMQLDRATYNDNSVGGVGRATGDVLDLANAALATYSVFEGAASLASGLRVESAYGFRYTGTLTDSTLADADFAANSVRAEAMPEGVGIGNIDTVAMANLSPTQLGALRAAGLSDLEIAGQIQTLVDVQLFRGTTPGFPGNPGLQRLGITPASTDPAIATVFATESNTISGHGVVFTGPMNSFAEGAIDIGSNRLTLEREVQVNMSAQNFEAQASTQIPVNLARKVLSDMGVYEIPAAINTTEQQTQILESLKPMSPSQIQEFLRRAKAPY